MFNWIFRFLFDDSPGWIRPRRVTATNLYNSNKLFCEERGITLEEIKHDIKNGWIYPSERPFINFSGTYKEEVTRKVPSCRIRMTERFVENHAGDLSFKIRNDVEFKKSLSELMERQRGN